MAEIAGRSRLTRRRVEPLRCAKTLGEHYQKKLQHYGRCAADYDRDLLRIFHNPRHAIRRRRPSSGAIARHPALVSKWTGEYQLTLDRSLTNDQRCRE